MVSFFISFFDEVLYKYISRVLNIPSFDILRIQLHLSSWVLSVYVVTRNNIRVWKEKWKMETQIERERERYEKGKCNNVAFMRGNNSSYIEHFMMMRYERLDEQRADKEGDERELGNKRRRLRIAAKSFNGTCCGRRAGLGTRRLALWSIGFIGF